MVATSPPPRSVISTRVCVPSAGAPSVGAGKRPSRPAGAPAAAVTRTARASSAPDGDGTTSEVSAESSAGKPWPAHSPLGDRAKLWSERLALPRGRSFWDVVTSSSVAPARNSQRSTVGTAAVDRQAATAAATVAASSSSTMAGR